MTETIAVLDLGKTNSKFLVIDRAGRILHRARAAPVWRREAGLVVLDDAAIEGWLRDCLAETAQELRVGGLTVSGHGCTFALARGRDLLAPVLDYEQEPPAEVAAAIDPMLPGYAETLTPLLPAGLSMGRQLLWTRARDPGLLDRAEWILSYPQFWGWRLGGEAVGEVSYLGCHSHLWNPAAGDYSSLVDAMGWRAKMPPLCPAGAPVGRMPEAGRGVAVPGGIVLHNGVHDSNAAFALHRAGAPEGFTLVSTGTWVIIMSPDCPVAAMDGARDMVGNVDVTGRTVPTLRFMGGREFDAISGGWRGPIPATAVAGAVAARAMALPAFAEAGPFPGRRGQLTDPDLAGEARAAVALLYVAMMTDLGLDLLQAEGPLVLDGGLVMTEGYAGLMAQLRAGQPVLTSDEAEGSAKGAALLAYAARGETLAPAALAPVAPLGVPGLGAYRDAWRAAVAAG
jgi:sugar (pentulose or hexulose) kinase